MAGWEPQGLPQLPNVWQHDSGGGCSRLAPKPRLAPGQLLEGAGRTGLSSCWLALSPTTQPQGSNTEGLTAIGPSWEVPTFSTTCPGVLGRGVASVELQRIAPA